MNPEQALECELCIIGAGYAGLNGLNAAAKYLKRGDRVVVIDANRTWGGQWLHQYDFVRLHQPYQMFTAGDQPWSLRRPPSYLATRREVLDHLTSVPGISAAQLQLTTLFEHRYLRHEVRHGRVEVDAQPAGSSQRVRVRARRLLKATGFDIRMLPPFPLSSSRVRSVGVSDPVLASPEFLASRAPIYLIGSGKTAMDCARHFIGLGREVHVILGSGMWFFSRDAQYPSGLRRYYRGILAADAFLNMALAFDGENEQQVMAELARAGQVINVFGTADNCRLGLLSLHERDQIRAGVREVHAGYVVDVEGTQLVLRRARQLRKLRVAEGAWFINCTTHLLQQPHEPVLQDGGLTCAPEGCLGFSGSSAYYLTHLWYRDRLESIASRLFRIRAHEEPKLRFVFQASLMVMANMALVGQNTPLHIPAQFRGEFTRWYPLHRQLRTLGRVIATRREIIRRAERLLPLRYSDAPDRARTLEPSLTGS